MIKTVTQQIIISQGILDLMSKFRNMVNDCIRIGLQNNVTSLKTLSTKSYRYLDRYDIVSYYKLHAISRASGILQNRKKSIKRGFKTRLISQIRAMMCSIVQNVFQVKQW
jgi:putative transposase